MVSSKKKKVTIGSDALLKRVKRIVAAGTKGGAEAVQKVLRSRGVSASIKEVRSLYAKAQAWQAWDANRGARSAVHTTYNEKPRKESVRYGRF